MAKRDEFNLTLEHCQRLTETAAAFRATFPKKWGEKPVSDDDQLIGREDLGALYKVLKNYSPWLQGIGKEYRLIFGEKRDWYPTDKKGDELVDVNPDDDRIAAWKFRDQNKTYKLRLDRDALSGAVWCCILRLHPHTPMPITTRDAVETWWPLIELLGKTAAVKKYIGLASAKRTEWEDDPDPEPEKKD